MGLDYAETKRLIDRVLDYETSESEQDLNEDLRSMGRTRQEFYDGIIKHGRGMDYTSDQWFDFHKKVPHWRLRRERALMDKLSPRQREILGVS